MAIFRCKMCGGTIEFNKGETVGVCDSCGTRQTLPRLDDEKKTNLYGRANHFRRNNDYDKAMSIYEQILSEDDTDAEAYWSIVLCKYGIEYVEDPVTHKRVPTINRVQYTSVFADEDYKSAIQHADGYQREIYESEAKAIDGIQKRILEVSKKEEPFDVFICYKETDENGKRTKDSVLAYDMYQRLTDEGLKVFFSRVTLEDKLGQEYEPYIFAALNSAPVMICVGTRPEYFNAVWVKNEWSRYLSLIKKGEKKTLIPAYMDMDPYDMPEEFSNLQAQNMANLGFMQDLVRGVKKIIGINVSSPKAASIVQDVQTFDVDKAIKRANLYIEDGQGDKATELLDKVIDADPQNTNAYISKLILEAKVKSGNDLVDSEEVLFDSKNLQRAIRFADDALKQKLTDIKYENAYRNAKRILTSASSYKECESAKSIFEKIAGYKDAEVMIGQSIEKGTSIQKEKNYEFALKLMDDASAVSDNSIEKLQKAIPIFESLIDYKDSAKNIDLCRSKIDELKINVGIKKRKTKKTVIIVGIAAAIITVAALVVTKIIIPNNNYSNAVATMNSSNYDGAVVLFEQLNGYKDSNQKITECKYKQGDIYYTDGKFETAAKYFEQILDYGDSQDKYNESIYQLAQSYYDRKDLDHSNPLYEKIKGYKDAQERIHYHSWTAATCTEPKTCKTCGETSGAALGHQGTLKCSRCGKVLFEPLVLEGTGPNVISNIDLINGEYIVTIEFDNNIERNSGTNIIIWFYTKAKNEYGTDINELLINDIDDAGRTRTVFKGSSANGYLDINVAENCNWKVTFSVE